MAAAIFSRMSLARPVEIMARGLVVLMPEPLNQKAEAILISNNMSLEEYRSKQLEDKDLIEGTVLFAFDSDIKAKVIEQYGWGDAYVLTDFVGDELEIVNPYGESVQIYGLCFETISNSLEKLVDRLNESGGMLK